MDFAHTEIWQHNPSGELYLVRLMDSDNIVGACGPVTQEDAEYTVNEASGWFNDDDDAETTEWVAANKGSFRVK